MPDPVHEETPEGTGNGMGGVTGTSSARLCARHSQRPTAASIVSGRRLMKSVGRRKLLCRPSFGSKHVEHAQTG
jgi:hypothetical protein